MSEVNPPNKTIAIPGNFHHITAMILQTLASGSKGNSIFIRSGETRILIDAGISCKQLSLRLQMIDEMPEKIQAIFITHEHSDHIQGARVFAKKYNIPVYMNQAAFQSASSRYKLEEIPDLRFFSAGDNIIFNTVRLHAHSVSHDTADPVCFTIDDGKVKAGILTDLGKSNTLLQTRGMELDILLLESNHDLGMLKKNIRYPEYLKQRIRGNQGHLSNIQAVELATLLIEKGKLKHLILGHLSEENNRADLALSTFSKAFEKAGIHMDVAVAPQHEPGIKILCDI